MVYGNEENVNGTQIIGVILTHLAYIANGKKTCYIVQQFHWANMRDVTLRHF